MQELDQRHFTVEPHHRIQPPRALENFLGFETGVMAAHREVGSDSGVSKGSNDPAKVAAPYLKNQGNPTTSGLSCGYV